MRHYTISLILLYNFSLITLLNIPEKCLAQVQDKGEKQTSQLISSIDEDINTFVSNFMNLPLNNRNEALTKISVSKDLSIDKKHRAFFAILDFVMIEIKKTPNKLTEKGKIDYIDTLSFLIDVLEGDRALIDNNIVQDLYKLLDFRFPSDITAKSIRLAKENSIFYGVSSSKERVLSDIYSFSGTYQFKPSKELILSLLDSDSKANLNSAIQYLSFMVTKREENPGKEICQKLAILFCSDKTTTEDREGILHLLMVSESKDELKQIVSEREKLRELDLPEEMTNIINDLIKN